MTYPTHRRFPLSDAATLRDARLLLADLASLLQARSRAWLASTAHLPPIEPQLVDQLTAALAVIDHPDAPVGLSDAIRQAADAPPSRLPIPARWSEQGRLQARALADAEALAEQLAERQRALGDGWRPMEPARGNGRFRSRTRRQAYQPNVAAG